jgi:glyoxylase-like metal-dependent hydrolase (beta-lactamase superfamily II)
MIGNFANTIAIMLLISSATMAQEAQTILSKAADAMGAANLKTIEFSGSGSQFVFGQNVNPNTPWPRFHAKSYTYAADYETPAAREEMVRTQALDPPRGGGMQPLIGEQRQVQFVSGNFAWDMPGSNPTPQPAAAGDRLLLLWLTPHGFLKSALKSNATVRRQTIGGRSFNVVSFEGPGKSKMKGYINEQNLVERVETRTGNPVLGDMLVETTYAGYRDFGGVEFPSKIVEKQGGYPVLDIAINSVKSNIPVSISVPDAVRQASPPAVRVASQKIADGVYFIAGGTHNSVAVECKDFVVVVEAPLNEERSLAVIGEVKRLIPDKPIKYLVNTHTHFDHLGGVRTYAAEGATIVTQQANGAYLNMVLKAPHTIHPDKLAGTKTAPRVETVAEEKIITDGTRRIAIHHVQGSSHNDAMLIVYLTAEKILIEPDMFPDPPIIPPPPRSVWGMPLYDNIQRLKLDVKQIAPLHGAAASMEDFLMYVGKPAL